jgi:hypothetical protein
MCHHRLRAFQRWGNAEVRRTSRAGIVANDRSCEAEGATLDRVPASQPGRIEGGMLDPRFYDCNMKISPARASRRSPITWMYNAVYVDFKFPITLQKLLVDSFRHGLLLPVGRVERLSF